MPIGLVHEFTFRAALKPPVAVGAGPYGQRIYFEVVGGDPVTGERLNGKVLTGGGDWILAGADGLGRLDVRAQIETDDGAFVYVQYGGILEMNEAVMGALQTGAATDWDDQYFRTTPRFECGDERYAWLQRHVFVGEGHVAEGGAVEYRVHRVT